MSFKNIKALSKFCILAILLFCSSILSEVNAQCGLTFNTTVTQISTCRNNGKILVTLTGDTSAFTNVLYSIEATASSSFAIVPNLSRLLENIPAGTHRVRVDAVCGETPVAQWTTVQVGGSYAAPEFTVSERRNGLDCGNYGQANLNITVGKGPFTILLTKVPPIYTGRLSWSVTEKNSVIDSLAVGAYTIRVLDSCGGGDVTRDVTVNKLNLATSIIDIQSYPFAVTGSCTGMYLISPNVYQGYPAYTYLQSDLLQYAISFNGGEKLPYRNFNDKKVDSVLFNLPAGQSLKDIYGKPVKYYIKTVCGPELEKTTNLMAPDIVYSYSVNCNTNCDISAYVRGGATCFPVYLKFYNASTQNTYYDTAYGGGYRYLKGIPLGTYYIDAATADGYIMNDDKVLTIQADTSLPRYMVSTPQYGGTVGNDGAAMIAIVKPNAIITAGTRVRLINNANYVHNVLVTSNGSNGNYWLTSMLRNNVPTYIYPGSYSFEITDECGPFYFNNIVISENDVYRYNWTTRREQVCGGLKVTPSGGSYYQGKYDTGYFKIISGPAGVSYSSAIVKQGGSLLLPVTGTYKIAVSASASTVTGYDSVGGGIKGNAANIKTINYVYNSVRLNLDSSSGWVCPRAADSLGRIRVRGLGGVAASGRYFFKLAEQGYGVTGPYLDSNYVGEFGTTMSGGRYALWADRNYDIKIEDDCGAFAVQSLKILNLATAPIAWADKPSYCIGDPVLFNVMNLPATAITYNWTGPDYFRSEQEAPSFKMGPLSGGTYHVAINSDMCGDPIEANIVIALNPYANICYSAVTDTVVNPYVTGLLGNWRSNKSYVYYSRRAESDPMQPVKLRTGGSFADFSAFWKFSGNKMNVATDLSSNWTWNSAMTLFNNKGAEVENKDPLGRYNAGLYGYNGALATAVIQNARYQQSAYEGFEDYGFLAEKCGNTCPVGRHFDFSFYQSYISDAQSHTGRYSLLVPKDSSVSLQASVTALAEDTFALNVNLTFNKCVPGNQGLDGLRTAKTALLPVFQPGKNTRVLLSAWVKETVPCKGITYTGSEITIAVGLEDGTAQTVTIHPSGNIIEGWQRYEQVVEVPASAKAFAFTLKATGGADVYFDDIRIHPYHANMKSFAYDPISLRLMAELDENNYATFYEYDDDGTLIRVKKETERGIATIKETRSALLKEN